MKKLFTLMAFVLMAGFAFGQQKYKNIVVNGDMEGNAPAYEDYHSMPADAWNSFWVHEFPKGEVGETQYQGTATIVDGVGVDGSKCAKVVARSEAAADAAGNKVVGSDGSSLASWDCQFFIYGTEPMPQGKEVRLTMWVKADKAGSIETQAHWGPGDYNHYQLFGNINVTTEWTKIVTDVVTVSSDQSKEGDGKAFQSVAFNLSTDKEGNVFYFDNIKLEMKDPKEYGGNADWINFMRKGVFSDDPIGQVDYDSDGDNQADMKIDVSNFMIQVRDNETKHNMLVKAPIVETGDARFPYAVKVPTLDHYTTTEEVDDLDSDGNQQFDEEGNVLKKTVTTYYWSDGTEIGTSAPARYSSQFFVSTLHKMKSNERYKFVFWVKADKEASLGTQAHTMPTKYAAYDTFGGTSAFPVSTEWTKFELGEPAGNNIPGGANNCQTVAFDCYQLQEANNYYFVFEEFSFSEDNVTVEDRTLGTPEDIQLEVNSESENDYKVNTIDASGMLSTFEIQDFSFLTNPQQGDGIKLLDKKESDEEEGAFVDTFSSLLTWTDGGFVDGTGYYIDDEKGINIVFDEESVNGSKVNLLVWNNPESGISFANGNAVKTKLAVSNAGWYYIYNITLGGDGAGIKDAKIASQNDGVIYDLTGRQITKPAKGLYIQNGKKYIQK